jgi:hypothetical protein
MDLKIVTAVDAENPTLGDLELRAGQLQWVGTDDTDAADHADMVAQRIRQRLLLVRGEWYLDQRVGFPWREYVWGKAGVIAGPEKIRGLVRQTIMATPGVREVLSVAAEIDRAARRLYISATITTDLGVTVTMMALDAPMIVRV